MFTWTDNPLSEMHNQIKMLTYTENCKNLLTGKIKSGRINLQNGSEPEFDKKATEISFCLRQALEYFSAASDVSISTSPLLLYYGMLSFCKSLIVANSTSTVFIDDIKYHGLTTGPNTPQQKTYISNNRLPFKNEYVNLNDGVFIKLAELLQPNSALTKDCSFMLVDLLSSVPELSGLLSKYDGFSCTNVISAYTELKEADHDKSKVMFSIPKKSDQTIIQNHQPDLLTRFEVGDLHSCAVSYTSKDSMSIQEVDFLYNYQAFVGGRYFVLRTRFFNNDTQSATLLSQMLIDYAIMFILGEQVRYHQDRWSEVLEGKHDGIISIIESYLQIVIRRFPNFVLNELFAEEMDYGTPGRWQ